MPIVSSPRRRRAGLAAAKALLAALGLGAAPAGAEVERLDAIVAIVNDDVVLASELMERRDSVLERLRQQGAELPVEDTLMSQLMERLVIESLQLQMAEQRGIVIDDETLTEAVNGFARQNDMSFDEFRAALERDGMSYRQFREDVRRELQLQRVQRLLVNRRITITDQDIDDLIASTFFQEMISDEYRVGHILLAVEGSAPETIAKAEAAAQAIVAKLRDGADFAQLAMEHSAASTALEGGDLGWRRAGGLPSLFAERIIAMAPGETADPIRNNLGFHVVQLLEQRGVSQERQQQSLVRHILVRPSAIRAPAQTRDLAFDLHRRILAGEDFAALASEHSEDPGSALAGGDLGWTDGADFVPEFRAAMDGLQVGEVGEPFQSAHGWHIVQVQDRRDQDMSDAARRNMAMTVLHNRRFEEELQEWLQEIRDEAHVELRIGADAEG